MWYLADQDISFRIDYEVDGLPVVPDMATAVVRDSLGQTLMTEDLAASATGENLVVPAEHNQLGGEDYLRRFVTITFIRLGETHQQSRSYGITKFVPIAATPGDVRAQIGLDARELPDRDIDLLGAFMDLQEEYGSEVADALALGGSLGRKVNRAITLRAAVSLAHTFQLRTQQSVSSEDSEVARLSRIDFSSIRDSLSSELSRLMNDVVSSTDVEVVIFQTSTPTDPFSG